MNKNKLRINEFKIFYLPIIVSMISFFIIAAFTYNISTNYMKNQMVKSNIELTELLSRKIEGELLNNSQYTEQISNLLLNAGRYALNNKDKINNEYLNEISKTFEIDNVYYYLPNGELVSSSDGMYIGWTPKDGDPIDSFMKSGQGSYIEGVRKFTETNDYYQFVYVKDKDGYFIQLGYQLESIEHLMTAQVIQSILERVVAADNDLVYALVTDEDLMVISDTDLEYIGVNYADDKTYQEALKGNTLLDDWYYPKLDETVIEVIKPLSINDKISGLVVIGLSQRELKTNAFILAVIIFFVTTLVALIYLWVQRRNVIKPIDQLCSDIDAIDIEKPENNFDQYQNSIFYGLYESVDNLLTRLQLMNVKNRTLNEQIVELAYQDYLTKLPNRFSFQQEFENFKTAKDKVAIVLLDLDNFKEINDTKGHSFGDELLVLLGQRLNKISNSNIFVSRYGGDEFMISIGFDYQEILMESINKIENIFIEPFLIRDEWLVIEASIGVSMYPQDDDKLEVLTTFSDMAMYSVKDSEKSGVAFYKKEMKEDKLRNIEIKKCLKEAIENDGFKMLYQPIVDATTGDIYSYEALIRFKDHDIFPDEFIPVAETTGLIIPIGRYVIESAIKLIASWKAKNQSCKRVSVNFSTKQFHDNELFEFIDEKLEQYRVSGDCLSVEVTETLMLEKSVEEVKVFLKEFKQRGIKIEMDDFGTGFTSVLYLNQFPLDTIKLDRSFVEWNLKDSSKSVFIEWIKLFKAYNSKVIAEGIETKEQYDKVKAVGVDYVQGYYFSRPVLPEDLINLSQ